MKRYRIRNWSEYNKSLIQRGSITFWIEEKALKNWFSSSHTCMAGRPEIYSDEAILTMLVLRELYHLPLRALEGFVQSLFAKMGINLSVPCYTQISRRAKSLHKRLKVLTHSKKARHLIFDSTGLKVHGEGEWKVRTHGKSKRRTWRKFHIGIDADTQDIVCCELTSNSQGDARVAEGMLKGLPGKVKSVRGDGAYDAVRFREIVDRKGGTCIVPPPRDATYKGVMGEVNEAWIRSRDDTVATICGLGGGDLGRKLWKILSGYYKRSLVESTMFRVKKLFGDKLKARLMDTQKSEVLCKCIIINKMNSLGMPRFEWVEEAA